MSSDAGLIYLQEISDGENEIECDDQEKFQDALKTSFYSVEVQEVWKPSQEMNFGFGQPTMTNIDGKLYIFGGCDRKLVKISNEMKCFDVGKF